MNDVDGQIIWAETTVPTLFWPTKLTRSLRLKFFLTGVVYPLICFVANWADGPAVLDANWQSGDFSVYANELLAPPAFYCWLPIVSVSMLAISWWCLKPSLFGKIFVRAGIYSGAVYSGILTVLLISCTNLYGPFFAAIVMGVQALLFWIVGSVFKRVFRFTILNLLIFTTLVAVIVTLGINLEWDIYAVGFMASLFVIGGASTMAFVTFCRVSVAVANLNHPVAAETDRKPVIVALLAWIVASILTWRSAIIMMLDQYHQLPVEPPDNCFVSNAAAHGHPLLVGSKLCRDGQRRNLQMARLKFLEFAMQEFSPSVHRICRRIYNYIGPPLASFLRRNVWLASLAYLALIPLALFAVLLQKSLSISENRIRQLYKL